MDGLLGTFIYSYSLSTLAGVKQGKIPTPVGALATRYVDVQPCLFGTLNMLVPFLLNNAGTPDALYIVQVVRLSLISAN